MRSPAPDGGFRLGFRAVHAVLAVVAATACGRAAPAVPPGLASPGHPFRGCWSLDVAAEDVAGEPVAAWLSAGSVPTVLRLDTVPAREGLGEGPRYRARSFSDGREEEGPLSAWRRLPGDSILVERPGALTGMTLRLARSDARLEGVLSVFTDALRLGRPARRRAPVRAEPTPCPEADPGGPTGTLVVANRRGGSVSFFDLELGVEVARLPVGPRIPHEVAVSPEGRRAITGEYGTGDAPGRRLVVFDLAGARETGRIDLGPRSRPHSMAFLPDGRRAVATMEASDRLALVDVEGLEVLRTQPTGGREGHMVRLSPDGRRAYVTNRGAAGTLSVIFLDEDRTPVVVPTGAGAEGLAVTPDGREVWVGNRDAATISVVATEVLRVVATLPSPPDPRRVEISPTGRVLVPNAAEGGSVAVYDRDSRELVENVPIAGGGSFGILVHRSAALLSDRAAGRILIWDPDARDEIRTLATGHDAPDGMAWSPLRVAPFD